MSSQGKKLGIESLEARLNQSMVPMVEAAQSIHYAMPVERAVAMKAMTIKVAASPKVTASSQSKTLKPAAKPVVKPVVKPLAKPVVKPVAKPVAKPVVKKPTAAPQTTSTKQTPSTASVTLTSEPSGPQTTITTPTTATTVTTPTVPSAPTTPTTVNTPAITSPPTNSTTPTTLTAPSTQSVPPAPTPPSSSVTPPANTPATTSNTTIPSTPPAPDPLAPILAQLYGDDVHDDSGTIQELVDTANADGLTNITLPAGTFLLDKQVNIYGTGLTFSGQGAHTILDVNHYHTGIDALQAAGQTGEGLQIMAVFDPTPLMIAQPVTGNTIVFTGNANLSVGQSLYLSDGLGSSEIIEAQQHGALTQFNELGPSEYVQIASVTQSGGNTVVTLAQNVIGSGEYGNVGPAGEVSLNYLHASTIQQATSNITLQNFAVEFKAIPADQAINAKFTDHLTIDGVHILNSPMQGGPGGIGLVSSTNALIENITSTSGSAIQLNTVRASTVINCNVGSISLEESSTDDLITHNTLTTTTTCGLRINDMACMRNTLSYNDVHGGTMYTGAIAIAEGTDTTIENNTVHDGDALIWLGITSGTKVFNNVADAFANYSPLDTLVSLGNSWGS